MLFIEEILNAIDEDGDEEKDEEETPEDEEEI